MTDFLSLLFAPLAADTACARRGESKAVADSRRMGSQCRALCTHRRRECGISRECVHGLQCAVSYERARDWSSRILKATAVKSPQTNELPQTIPTRLLTLSTSARSLPLSFSLSVSGSRSHQRWFDRRSNWRKRLLYAHIFYRQRLILLFTNHKTHIWHECSYKAAAKYFPHFRINSEFCKLQLQQILVTTTYGIWRKTV